MMETAIPSFSDADKFARTAYALKRGVIETARGELLYAKVPEAILGEQYLIERAAGGPPCRAEVVAFSGEKALLSPFEDTCGISNHSSLQSIPVPSYTGAINQSPSGVFNCFGESLDGGPPCTAFLSPQEKRQGVVRVEHAERIMTGIHAIDLLTPLGRGQRLVLLSEAGVGKSTLLSQITQNVQADWVVVALCGERNREVSIFLEHVLGRDRMQHSSIFVATSGERGMRKRHAVHSATQLAAQLRAQGLHVLLIVDSLTRYARAIRDVSLAVGELPIRNGFTPSVYSDLPVLIERAGITEQGSITALYSLLTEETLGVDPFADEIKSLVDGHLRLDQTWALLGLRPAIDCSRSLSRWQDELQSSEERSIANRLRSVLIRLQNDKDAALFQRNLDPELEGILALKDSLLTRLSADRTSLSYSNFLDHIRALLDRIPSSLSPHHS